VPLKHRTAQVRKGLHVLYVNDEEDAMPDGNEPEHKRAQEGALAAIAKAARLFRDGRIPGELATRFIVSILLLVRS